MLMGLILLIAVFVSVDSAVAEQSFWEGRISAAPYGLLPGSGMYAASNAFPLDSKVSVSIAEDGRQIEVRIVERLDVDRVFMQLSPEAAQKVGLKTNEVLIARVSPVQDQASIVEKSLAREAPYSQDPDVNPSSTGTDGRLAVIQEYLEEEEPVEGDSYKISQPEPPLEPVEEPVKDIAQESEEAADVAEAAEIPEISESPAEVEGTEAAQTADAQSGAAPESPEVTGMAVVHAIPEQTRPTEDIDYTLPPPEMKQESDGEAAVTQVETPAESETDQEISVSTQEPQIVAMEPIFRSEKDYSYSPDAPGKPETIVSREGPRVSMETVEPSSLSTEAELIARHSPEPPRDAAPVADLGVVEEAPEAAKAPDEVAHEPKMPAEKTIAEEAPPESAEPEEPSEPEELTEIPEDAELVLVPAEDRPPEGPPTVPSEEPGKAEESSRQPRPPRTTGTSIIGGPVSVLSNLERQSYYLQVGAYSKLDLAQNRAASLASRYPVMIYSEAGGSAPYKLMIGPLNEDESDTLLYTFTARGYSDAFIRRGN